MGLSSGTAALHLALVSWGGPGDVVPVFTFTFAATVKAIRYDGAEPHFILVGAIGLTMVLAMLRRRRETARRADGTPGQDMTL